MAVGKRVAVRERGAPIGEVTCQPEFMGEAGERLRVIAGPEIL